MQRLRLTSALIATALAATLIPSAAGAADVGSKPSTASEVDFGDCVELSTGTVVPLTELQARVPDSVPVLSLSEQGTVFPGSDDVGILITRTLDCESITVTRNGITRTQNNRHIAHVGTPVDTDVLPASPFSNDGGNGADFNNYILGYYSDSSIYLDAMRLAGIQFIAPARIEFDDVAVDECVVDRTVNVYPFSGRRNYGFSASGIIPDAACEEPVVPFIANWWSVAKGKASVLSNDIPGQSAIFIDTATTIVEIEPTRRSQLSDIFGGDAATADAFGVIGFIPDTPAPNMFIAQAGKNGGELEGAEFSLQNFFSTPGEDGGRVLLPFFDPIVAEVGPGPEVAPFLYDFDFTATAIEMVWNTTPDDELPEGAEPNDFYPPYVASAAGLTQEQAAAAGLADEYWFDFDRDLTGLVFTVDTTQTLVPEVRLEGTDTLVISVPGGTDIGDGFDARILVGSR